MCLHASGHPRLYLGWSGDPGILGQRGMAVCLHALGHPRMYLEWSGVTRESWDTWIRGMAVCLHAVCYPGMYLGWSGVTRESWDTWTEVGLCACMLYVIPGCIWNG